MKHFITAVAIIIMLQSLALAYSYYEQRYSAKGNTFKWRENKETGQIEYAKVSYYNERLEKWVLTELRRSK